MPRVILTGGPGVGKTTVLRELASLGYATVDESARAIIRERVAAGLSPRPEPGAFAAEILRRDMSKYQQTSEHGGWTFFDRSALEAVGMVQEASAMSAPEVAALLAGFSFHPSVFILPPWPEIYTKDDERDHSLDHCIAVHAALVSWYTKCGYQLQEVPRLTPADRAGHVLRVLADAVPNPSWQSRHPADADQLRR